MKGGFRLSSKKLRTLLVVCGETSGEAHASGVVRYLKQLSPDVQWRVFGSGGEKMRDQGAEIMLDVSRLSAIGPKAAMGNLKNYLSLRKQVLKRVRNNKPDLALLVDFPDFNLPLARKLKQAGIPVCYFISPQLWAWRKSRIRQIRKYVDLMLVIFPFEESFYRKHGVKAVYVGNPTAARLASLRKEPGFKEGTGNEKPTVALLPGSRIKEVEQILPIALEAAAFAARDIDARFLIFRAPEISRLYLEAKVVSFAAGKGLDAAVVDNDYQLLARADCAVVKSGTSTLETLLLGVPFAMVYRLPLASYILLRPFVRTTTFCLANLVAEKRLVPEFIQGNATAEGIGSYIRFILKNSDERERLREAFRQVAGRLGEQEADRRAAEEIIEAFFRLRRL